jgi:hypothetical protein
LALDLSSNLVVLRESSNSATQQWLFDVRTRTITNLSNDLLLHAQQVNGPIVVAPPSNDKKQQWVFVKVSSTLPRPPNSPSPPQPTNHPQQRPTNHPQQRYSDHPQQRYGDYAPARPVMPHPPADYDDQPLPPGRPDDRGSTDRVLITVTGHPEFALDYGAAPRPDAPIYVGRPEQSPRQSWIREPRGPGFILRAGLQPALAMAVGDQSSVVLALEKHAVVWQFSERDGTISDAQGRGVLTVKDGRLNQNVPVLISRPEGWQKQSWYFWPGD